MFYLEQPGFSHTIPFHMSTPTSPGQRIEIASKFEELEMVVDAAEAFYKQCFDQEDRIFTGVLLASEVVTNAIEHGNQNDESKRVIIEFRSLPGRSECWVEDEGNGFDREAIADPWRQKISLKMEVAAYSSLNAWLTKSSTRMVAAA